MSLRLTNVGRSRPAYLFPAHQVGSPAAMVMQFVTEGGAKDWLFRQGQIPGKDRVNPINSNTREREEKMMNIEYWLSLLAVALLLWVWRTYHRQRRAIRQRSCPAELDRYPSVSVIRPIKGLDTGAEDNIRAALDHGYPGAVETFFVFDDENEPTLPLVEQVLAERNRAGQFVNARIIFTGQPLANRTGKLNSMIAGFKASKNELVAFVDSDVRQDRKALRVLVESLFAADGAGAAFAPVIASEPPATVGDAGYTLMINGLYEPSALASADESGGELPFIMGQFMVFKREAIAAIGGLEAAEGQLVDDMFLGRRLNECGYRNRCLRIRWRLSSETRRSGSSSRL